MYAELQLLYKPKDIDTNRYYYNSINKDSSNRDWTCDWWHPSSQTFQPEQALSNSN